MWLDHSLFLCPSSDGRLGCLHLLAVVNHVAMDTCVHVFVGTAFCSCFGSISGSGIPRPHSHFMFNLLRKACPPFLAPFLKKHGLRSSHCRIDQGPPALDAGKSGAWVFWGRCWHSPQGRGSHWRRILSEALCPRRCNCGCSRTEHPPVKAVRTDNFSWFSPREIYLL